MARPVAKGGCVIARDLTHVQLPELSVQTISHSPEYKYDSGHHAHTTSSPHPSPSSSLTNMAPAALSASSKSDLSTSPSDFLPAPTRKMNGAPTDLTDFPLIPAAASSSRPQDALDAPIRTEFAFDPIQDAVQAFARGEFVIVMDDEGRENEGDLIIAGSAISTQKMAWMIKHSRSVPPPSLNFPFSYFSASPNEPHHPHAAGTSASRSRATASKRSPYP